MPVNIPQLEDDVISKEGYYSFIMSNIETHGDQWFILKFSLLGFIGKHLVQGVSKKKVTIL